MEVIATDAMIDEARAFNEELERLLATVPSIETVPLEAAREARRSGRGLFAAQQPLPQARELSVPGRSGAVTVRVLAPEREPDGVYLHLHGGGWTIGAADAQDGYLWEIVEATGLCVASVEYRLAPEHPHPAGLDDCEDAALWLVREGAAALGAPARLAIGGESSGAHLAASTLLRLRDGHDLAGAFAAASLVYGSYDLSQTPSQRLWKRNLVLSPPVLAWFRDNLLPGLDAEGRRDPGISPLYADLRGLPPALFMVGTLDPLLDDSVFMEARWRLAGGTTELLVWPESVHGFTAFPLALARTANEAQHAFLLKTVGSSARG